MQSAKSQSPVYYLEILQQKSEIYQLEPFVVGFLQIWLEIHQQAVGASLDDLLPITKKILAQSVLPFFEKFKTDPNLKKVDPWFESYASILLTFENRGSYLIPLHLVTYEICYSQKGMLLFFLRRLETREIRGTKEELFEFLIPILNNFIVPLDEIDIGILKTSILLEKGPLQISRAISYEAYTSHIDMSARNIIRRLNRLKFIDVISTIYFLDMGQLGYETMLLFHTNDFPSQFEDYLLLSGSIQLGTFSVVQIPYRKTQLIQELQESLDSVLLYPLTQRVMNWNLSGLATGEDPWQKPPSLLYGIPKEDLISPSPSMDISLEPFGTPFELSPADIKILDFLSSQGDVPNLKSLSDATKVSVKTISKAFQRYREHKLMTRMAQFFSIGLDLSIFFFLTIEDDSIPWIDHFLTFPKADVFVHRENSGSTYAGFLKIPNKWIKPFSRNMDKTVRALRDTNIKFYHKILSSIDHFKWGISLQKTL
ncbi:MAG: hypothetical protein ACFFE8_02575 [Candidatus Heimdallarchaeota archaeon]